MGRDKPPENPRAGLAPLERRTGTRTKLALPVRCRYESVLDFVETQSMNISHTGMFIMTDDPAALGSQIDFEFILGHGFTLLKGSAEVMRVVQGGVVNGMGVRFVDLDAANRNLIARIVAVNQEEGRNSTVNFDFSRPATAGSMPVVQDDDDDDGDGDADAGPDAGPDAAPAMLRPIAFDGRKARIVLGPLTAHHFTQNPLLNVKSGGFFIPAEEDVPLGTIFQVEIVDGAGRPVVAGKGKVVAKQELRVGIRLVDVDKDGMARLRAEVGKFASMK